MEARGCEAARPFRFVEGSQKKQQLIYLYTPSSSRRRCSCSIFVRSNDCVVLSLLELEYPECCLFLCFAVLCHFAILYITFLLSLLASC